jgi:hypothetical protein
MKAFQGRVLVIAVDRATSRPAIFHILDEIRGEETFFRRRFTVQDYVYLVWHGSLIIEALTHLLSPRCVAPFCVQAAPWLVGR